MAAALIAGAAAPAGAAQHRPAGTVGTVSTLGTSATAGGTAAHKGAATTWITLITGDRIGVDRHGKAVALKHGAGREHIPVELRTAGGHTYAYPMDALRLIEQGRVDRRLFDVTTLSRPEYRRAQADGLGYIVSYQGGGSTARTELHKAAGAKVTHTYAKLDAEAVTAPANRTTGIWKALTEESGSTPYASAEPGLRTVWLDAVQKASALDWSRQQIGAPTAWYEGYDGTGVKIAVLDTGVDQDHKDLAGKVAEVKNFSTADNTDDHYGHGTHVASIAAGSGVLSGGTYKGVAPGAKILAGKVLDDDGYGDDSNILAGLEWAAVSGAKVANLSLGGTDTPGTDVLESAVNTLSAQYGTLFVIAAGNEGNAAGTVGSPGSADAALTVGAVDKAGALAGFSSRGPRVGDGGLKPDVTAPGVDITAAAAPGSLIDQEVGENPPGYLTISGTSMATPHVAGAAADLAQEHPDWTGQQLKAALVASTADSGKGYTPFEQGTGRIDLARAVHQTVTAKAGETSLGFGTAVWPHADDPKLTKALTYTNAGSTDVTLNLTAKAAGPDGKAAPAGFYKLSASTVTVPAGGSAHVDVTVDTTLGGTLDGAYTAYITAKSSDGGQVVRTAAGVTREVESYDVTVKHLGRDGKATADYDTALLAMDGAQTGNFTPVYDKSGTATVRVPKGRYLLTSTVFVGDGSSWQGGDWINQPNLTVSRNTAITVDARTAKPVDITVPDSKAVPTFASAEFSATTGDFGADYSFWLDSFANFRTAHLGPAAPAGTLHEIFAGVWTKGATSYNLAYGLHKDTLVNGYAQHPKTADLAKTTVKLGASVKGRQGMLFVFGMPADGGAGSSASASAQALPATDTVYANAGKSVTWVFEFQQLGATDDPFASEADYVAGPYTWTPGHTYNSTFNVAVFGPRVGGGYGLYRTADNEIYGNLPVLADGAGHDGFSLLDTAVTTLYRNGTKLASVNDELALASFTVPAGKAAYKLTTDVSRSAASGSLVSTRVTAAWTFSSQSTTAENGVQLPASAVKFSPSGLTLASTAKAGLVVSIPVSVQGSAAGTNLKSLKTYASYDGGKHWETLTVKNGAVALKNPKSGKTVTFKAEVTDKQGNTLSQVIYNAYLSK